MGYSFNDQIVGKAEQNDGLHEKRYMREKLHALQGAFTYFSTPKQEDYLTLRQRGSLEGLAESLYKLKSAQNNNTYGSSGTCDIAPTLGLYNPASSFSANYSPGRKRNPYDREDNGYSA